MTHKSGPLALPEIAHMLDVMTGAQTALNDLMKTAKKEKDPSIIRLCVSESENISKTATRLAQAMSAWEAENPGQVRRNDPPPPSDPETDALMDRFMEIMRDANRLIHEETMASHVRDLIENIWPESEYRRQRDHVHAPNGDVLCLADWYEILRRYRGLTPAEQADFTSLTRKTETPHG